MKHKIKRHLDNAALNFLVRDFNRYTFGQGHSAFQLMHVNLGGDVVPFAGVLAWL
jgi:hypothetical protein